MEDDLVAWGRVVRIETTGRVTGRPATATVGFVEDPDGALLVAAGSPNADWALNLIASSACRVTLGDASWAAEASLLDAAGHAFAVRELILKYGTPSEGLGSGPSFALRRDAIGPSGPVPGADRTADAPGSRA